MTHHDFDQFEVLEQLSSDESDNLDRQTVNFLCQPLIDIDATESVQVERHKRTVARTTQLNDSRPRLLTTKVDDRERTIPKLRMGNVIPSGLERRHRHWRHRGRRHDEASVPLDQRDVARRL